MNGNPDHVADEPRKGLLLLEDNELDVEFVRRMLRRLALETALVHAVDGEAAVTLIQGDALKNAHPPRPFAVLIDINMPRMSGFEFLDLVRSEPGLSAYLADIPLYVLSSSSLAEDRDAARARGAGFLTKPITREKLMEVLGIP